MSKSALTTEAERLLTKYAETKMQIAALQDELSLTEDLVKEIVERNCDGKYRVSGLGTLSVGSRKNYAYPPVVKDMESDLKQAKKDAEADGTAIASFSHYLTFRKLVVGKADDSEEATES